MTIETLPDQSFPSASSPLRPRLSFLTASPIIAATPPALSPDASNQPSRCATM